MLMLPICVKLGKLFANWHKRAASANFLKELSKTVESPNVGGIRFVSTPELNSELVDSSFLVHITKGGLSTDQGVVCDGKWPRDSDIRDRILV
jgi:hypothetical protein